MKCTLDDRSRSVLHRIVDAFIETGEPVGSKTVSSRLGMSLSPATIRHVMANLVDAGFLYSPHTSAGRLPTEAGLRFFVNGLLELGDLTERERQAIESQCQSLGRNFADVLEEATALLSGLSQCASWVIAPKIEQSLKHIEFVHAGTDRVLVIMVSEDGMVENRIIEIPHGMPPSTLTEASNYVNAKLTGKNLEEVRARIAEEVMCHKADLDALSTKVVEAGLAVWSKGEGSLIVRGQSHLLRDVTHMEDLEKLKRLFSILEARESLAHLLDEANKAEGVQIFIGSESSLFNVVGCSAIVAPYLNSKAQIIGAIGVVGPTRINYGKIIPMVDYTAKMITKVLNRSS